MNIGGAGSYVYDNPAGEAPAASPLETDGKPQEEEKKTAARGPVKGETASALGQKKKNRRSSSSTGIHHVL